MGTIVVVHQKTQKLVAELPLDGPASAVTAHPHRRLVAVQSFVKGFTVRLWDLDNGGKATVVDRVLVSHGITFSADGRLLAFDDSVSEGNWVCVWEVDPVKQRTRLRTDIHCDVGLEFLGDTHTLAVGGGKYLSEHVIEIWDIEGRLLRTLSKQEDDIILQKFVATRDGLTIVGGLVYTVRVWDVSTGKAIKEFAAQGEGIVDMAMTKNGEWLAIAHGDIAEDYSGGHAKITIWRLK